MCCIVLECVAVAVCCNALQCFALHIAVYVAVYVAVCVAVCVVVCVAVRVRSQCVLHCSVAQLAAANPSNDAV